ncbi:hypothetical protein BRPE64_ECDS02990 (plasmid) [Caballeronia insecticola]|uniref:Uncharacterized protein n=1 Tax=Caballeronia insecticola TaxID=758793 RepID=A0A060PKT5_9BURK|nr:hypothetical protein BRPE64_ECDS02990 [Caballeronia insecticola]
MAIENCREDLAEMTIRSKPNSDLERLASLVIVETSDACPIGN